MSMPPKSSQAPSIEIAVALGAFIAMVAAATITGIVLAVSLLTGTPASHGAAHAATGTFGVAEDVPTSFGFVAVEHAETIKGLSAKQLGGAIHGIGSFVARDRALVKASATLRNGVRGTLDYSIGQFRLRATGKDGQVRRYPVSHATVGDGTLQPDAALDLGLAFVVPRSGASLALEFTDPGRSKPVVIDLGSRSGTVSAAE